MRLVITEKPSVAQAVARVIGADERKNGYMEGNGYIVSWCIGHLVELAQPDAYSDTWKKWNYESLPMIPEKWLTEVKSDTAVLSWCYELHADMHPVNEDVLLQVDGATQETITHLQTLGCIEEVEGMVYLKESILIR